MAFRVAMNSASFPARCANSAKSWKLDGPRIVEAANNAMVESEVRQRLKALKIAALRQNHVVEIRGFVEEDINADDIFVALENLGLLVVVSPPLNRVACVAERHFSRLGVVKVGV